MNRREFLYKFVIVGVSLATSRKLLAQVDIQRFQVIIERNHGHTMSIREKDMRDGKDHSYNIKGQSFHSHTVRLTKEQFMQILNGEMVSVMSSRDFFHRHRVNVRWRDN